MPVWDKTAPYFIVGCACLFLTLHVLRPSEKDNTTGHIKRSRAKSRPDFVQQHVRQRNFSVDERHSEEEFEQRREGSEGARRYSS